MTPKEKAFDLIGEFRDIIYDFEKSKICALKCVDEIDKSIDYDWMEIQNLDREHVYWQKVKEEIKNI